ncbi:hypothetical protein BAQ48_05485 [Bacillus luti]|nr:hypothetical protein BAQ48_05485 [Bacillus luti]
MWANLLQKSQKKVSLYPVPTAGRRWSKEEVQTSRRDPIGSTNLLQKSQKKVSLYYSLSKKGSQIGVWRGIIFVKSR